MVDSDKYVKWIELSIGLIYIIIMCIQFWSTPIGNIPYGIFILNAILAVLIFLAIIGIVFLIILVIGLIVGR